MGTGIVQLRVRTEFSFREAFGKIPKVAERLVELETPAAGIVDGGTWGHVRWLKELRKHNIKPLFGLEQPLRCESGKRPRFWLLATDTKKFYQLSTALHAKGIDEATQLDFLRNAEGVARFAGTALTDPDTFDYIDINPGSTLSAKRALRLHEETGKPLVVTSDNTYPSPSHFGPFMAFSGRVRVTPQHILSRQELRQALFMLSDEQFDAAVEANRLIAERCAGDLPIAPIIHFEGDLIAEVERGRQKRLALGHIERWTEEHQKRLERELEQIHLKEYESYFLVVSDLVDWAKKHMLVGPARGSSAGSLVCYLLNITEVDPLQHDLLFERFIDISRNDLPDIDIDFSDQHKVFAYLAERYGAGQARIGNINSMRARSVIARVCKELGIPEREKFDVLDVLIEYSSGDSRYGHALEDTLSQTEPGKRFREKYPEAKVMFELENHASHTGVHAAGIIVCNEPVPDFCTVGNDGVAQLDKPDAELLGLLKIDALGLRTLAVIDDTGVVKADDLYALKLDDPEVFKVFNDRHYASIFQFEGQAQRRVSAEVWVDSFKQIDHVTALARPGPLGGGASQKYIARAAGREPVEYRHPSMAAYLGDTMGVVLYQEQVMRICVELGKFDWEATTEIRKAMSGRKGKEYFDRRGEQFVAGATSQGVAKADAEEIWNEICTFGAWGMNKCVAGSTRIKLAHPNQTLGTDPSIADLYAFYKEAPSSWVKQRKAMPVLMAVGEDGIARPTKAVDIHKNGVLPVYRYTFSNGEEVVCTRLHKFIINGEWQPIKTARYGDEFAKVERHQHTKAGDWLPPYARGWQPATKPAYLVEIEKAGETETYDVEMPVPNHNYVLANGLVTHNSHTVSYAVISYWCAWLKRYYPLEYFAASLRNAKDDKQAFEILREANEEGYGYVPFDPERSVIDWQVVDGELVGGFKNLVGYGPAKAATAIEQRRLGKLDLEKLSKHEIKFKQLYPMQANWGHVYDDPTVVGCARGSRFDRIKDLPEKGDVLILVQVDRKELRDENETIRVARRDGKKVSGQSLFLDVFVSDDAGIPITLRFDRFKFKPLGQKAADRLKSGDILMARGYRIPNFAMVKAKKVRCLNRPEVFE